MAHKRLKWLIAPWLCHWFGKALEHLRAGLAPFVDRELHAAAKDIGKNNSETMFTSVMQNGSS